MTYQQVYDRAQEVKRPARIEDDYICNKCGEPWDIWGVRNGDMAENEKKRFFNGLGCPCCPKYGKQK